VKLGLENKKQAKWAAVLGVIAVIAVAYEFIPMFADIPVGRARKFVQRILIRRCGLICWLRRSRRSMRAAGEIFSYRRPNRRRFRCRERRE